MSNLPTIEVFLRSDPLEAVVVSDPPVEVNQPIFQLITPGNFATATQGELAETAVQPELLALALQGKENADPTILRSADIGNIVQPYNANTVIDSEYSTVKSKAQSALQPENNISLLTNNIGFITENIPDGARIGGVAHFCRATKPTARIDGSALVIGDRWWNTSDGTDWFWNGTYWLGEPFTIGNNIAVTDMAFRTGEDLRGLFLHYIVAKGRTSTSPDWDLSNYWQCNLLFGGRSLNNLARLDSTSGYVGGPDLHYYRKFIYNTAMIPVYPSAGGSNTIFSQIRSVGSPTPAGSGSASLSYFFFLSFIFL